MLGDKLENPYSVENMKIALDSIMHNIDSLPNVRMKNVSNKIEIKATDLYVRFLPKDTSEFSFLEKDTAITLFEHPLDYEIKQQGHIYKDPNKPKGDYYWMYTVVSTDYQFSEIEYEILSELFLPENSEYYTEEEMQVENQRQTSKNTSLDFNVLDILEDVSLYLTGNSTEESVAPKNTRAQVRIRSCWWFFGWHCKTKYEYDPSGSVKVKDDRLGYVPLKGVLVTAWRWFRSKSTYTNSSGNYYIRARFSGGKAYYKIKFYGRNNGNSWDIHDTWLLGVSSYWGGYKSVNGHNFYFGSDDSWRDLATIQNATYDYMDLCRKYRLTLPSSHLKIWRSKWLGSAAPLARKTLSYYYLKDNWWKYILNFAYTPVATSLANIAKIITPDIVIGQGSSESEDIYEAVFHELTHASHFKHIQNKDGWWKANTFWNKLRNYIVEYSAGNGYGNGTGKGAGYCQVAESWAYFMEVWLLNEHYGEAVKSLGSFYHRWLPSGFFRDLVYSGYTVEEFQNSFRYECNSLSKYKNDLLRRNNYKNKSYVEERTKHYNDKI